MQQTEQTNEQKAAASAAFLFNELAKIVQRESEYIDRHSYDDAIRATLNAAEMREKGWL